MGLRIALFGQAPFGRDTLVRLVDAGHEIAGVHVPPDRGRPDPLAAAAAERGIPLLRHPVFRRKGAAIPERVEAVRALGADLNVLAFVTVILPPEIVDAPPRGSLCFHPSLLPRFRGGNALAWQIMLGEEETGVSVFRPDAGVDTGPIVVQRGGVRIDPTDSAASLYFDKLYPLGLDAIVEAVDAVAQGRDEAVAQDDSLASHQGLVDDEAARLDWSRPVVELDRWIRGCDPQPGAWALRGTEKVRFFDGRRYQGDPGAPAGTVLGLEGDRLLVAAQDGRLAVGRVRVGDGKKLPVAEAGLLEGESLR